jgi:protein CWC15
MFGPSKKHSKLDENAHMTLKTRAVGQMSVKELIARDFKAELMAKEAKHFKRELPSSRTGGDGELMIGDVGDDRGERFRDVSAADGTGASKGETRFQPKSVDADESDDDDSEASEESDSDEDDTAALLAELERIKKERAEESARRAAEAEEREALEKAEEFASGNPLLNLSTSGSGARGAEDAQTHFGVKRRWDDDVVFKNQTRNEPVKKKRFVNDTIRSDFHRRFLNKYIK